MSDQPEALRLADALDEKWWIWQDSPTVELKAAAELRRQHAEIESLKAERDEDRRRKYGYSQQTVDALTKERDALRALLLRISSWDMMSASADGEFWKREIDAAIDAAREAGK